MWQVTRWERGGSHSTRSFKTEEAAQQHVREEKLAIISAVSNDKLRAAFVAVYVLFVLFLFLVR
jgi:hypothetical protein